MVEEKIYIVYHNYQSLPSEMEFLMTTNRIIRRGLLCHVQQPSPDILCGLGYCLGG